MSTPNHLVLEPVEEPEIEPSCAAQPSVGRWPLPRPTLQREAERRQSA